MRSGIEPSAQRMRERGERESDYRLPVVNLHNMSEKRIDIRLADSCAVLLCCSSTTAALLGAGCSKKSETTGEEEFYSTTVESTAENQPRETVRNL